MRIKNKIFVYMLISTLSFSSLSGAYYRSVYAMEWVGGALALSEVLKWVLGALGIVVGTKVASDVWERYSDDMENYLYQKGIDTSVVSDFIDNLQKGIIDKSSACWSAFKEWASSLISSGSGDVNYEDIGFLSGMSLGDTILLLQDKFGFTLNNVNPSNYTQSVYAFIFDNTIGGNENALFFLTNANYNLVGRNNDSYLVDVSSSVYPFRYYNGNTRGDNFSLDSTQTYNKPFLTFFGNYSEGDLYITENISYENLGFYDISLISVDGISTNSDFVGITDNVTDLDIISTNDSDLENKEVFIPVPGLGVSDDSISADSYDDIIDSINSGDMSIEDGVKTIQEITKVYVYDDTTDLVFPDNISGGDDTIQDTIQDNVSNSGFIINGLETVFPFCIPWDIYNFLGLLVADPVAPEFQFPFRDPKTKRDIMYTVSLAPFNSVAVVVRYGFDLMFIIGLALATRALIGGGSES